MTDIKSIRKAVEALSPAEFAEFRQWFAEFDATVWGHQIEQDAQSGALDPIASKSGATGDAPTKSLPYDVADQLRTPGEIAAYLDAWLQDAPGDAAGIARALSDIARAKPHWGAD